MVDRRWPCQLLVSGPFGRSSVLCCKQVLELAMYDDYINYYGFPRELGFIRVKRLVMSKGEVDSLIEVIIPRSAWPYPQWIRPYR